jgi:hypothetical protein
MAIMALGTAEVGNYFYQKNKISHLTNTLATAIQQNPGISTEELFRLESSLALQLPGIRDASSAQSYGRADVTAWYNDAKRPGLFTTGGEYSTKYSKDTTGWEQAWIKGLNTMYGRSETDCGGFSEKEFYEFHNRMHRMFEEGRNFGTSIASSGTPPSPEQVKSKAVLRDKFADSFYTTGSATSSPTSSTWSSPYIGDTDPTNDGKPYYVGLAVNFNAVPMFNVLPKFTIQQMTTV